MQSLHTGSASRPQSPENTGAALGVEVSHKELEVVGSPVAPPRLELPQPHMDVDQGSRGRGLAGGASRSRA
jgi:hypothetical protein